MSAARPSSLGATRSCPHCKATVLVSASICPGCQHHLRFNAADSVEVAAGESALAIETTIRRADAGPACEYCVVLSVADAKGLQIARHVVNVGVLTPAEKRTFKLSVELMPGRTP
jgi:uncharacterized paraquat-inducible protein A